MLQATIYWRNKQIKNNIAYPIIVFRSLCSHIYSLTNAHNDPPQIHTYTCFTIVMQIFKKKTRDSQHTLLGYLSKFFTQRNIKCTRSDLYFINKYPLSPILNNSTVMIRIRERGTTKNRAHIKTPCMVST